jgi:hypothetical protein
VAGHTCGLICFQNHWLTQASQESRGPFKAQRCTLKQNSKEGFREEFSLFLTLKENQLQPTGLDGEIQTKITKGRGQKATLSFYGAEENSLASESRKWP